MTARIVAVVLVVLVPALVAGQEKEKKDERKPSFIGVQIAKNKDGACIVLVVMKRSPAEKAGLKGGDVIVRIDGTKPADLETTVKVIRALKAGKKVKFEVKRDGKDKTIDVTPVAVTG